MPWPRFGSSSPKRVSWFHSVHSVFQRTARLASTNGEKNMLGPTVLGPVEFPNGNQPRRRYSPGGAASDCDPDNTEPDPHRIGCHGLHLPAGAAVRTDRRCIRGPSSKAAINIALSSWSRGRFDVRGSSYHPRDSRHHNAVRSRIPLRVGRDGVRFSIACHSSQARSRTRFVARST